MAPEGGPDTGGMSLLGTAAQGTAKSLETRPMVPKPDWHQHLLGKYLKIWIPSLHPTTGADLLEGGVRDLYFNMFFLDDSDTAHPRDAI